MRVERARTEGCLPESEPFSLPFSSSSSSSSTSALTFVSASSSRSYLLKTFVDLTSPLRSVLLREVETVQLGSPYASKAGWGQSVGPREERRRLRRGDDDLDAAVFGRHDADLHCRLVLGHDVDRVHSYLRGWMASV